MTKIVNLRLARKRKLKSEEDQQAAENRAKFGRTKGEKKRVTAEMDRVNNRLDQANLTPDKS